MADDSVMARFHQAVQYSTVQHLPVWYGMLWYGTVPFVSPLQKVPSSERRRATSQLTHRTQTHKAVVATVLTVWLINNGGIFGFYAANVAAYNSK